MLRLPVFLLFCLSAAFAADPTAQALARAASKAQNSGQLVRAYLLYAEAAARDPQNLTYRANRDGLKPLAGLLSKAGIEKEPNHDELLSGVSAESEEPLARIDASDREEMKKLHAPPALSFASEKHSFHARSDERTLFSTVAGAYGVTAVLDPLLEPRGDVRFDIEDVDLRGALKALTDSTNTFVFPLSPNTIFVVRDTPQKRDEYEPQVSVSVPLPEIVDEKSTSEVSNAVRQAFDLRHIGMDSVARTIVIRDKISRANAARVLLESLVRPKAQIAVEVKILSVDDQSNMRYGLSLPTSFPLVNFGNFGLSKALVAIPAGFVNFITFGGGATLFGIGVTDVQAIATYSKALSKNFFDTTVVVAAGETAQMHIGDKYPVAQSLYTGSSQFEKALYGPPPQIQMVDLGILVKVKPELHADGDITMEVHAEYQALGTMTFNTVPEILNRQFEGTVRLRSGELAVVAGLDSQTSSVSRNGVAGLSDIPSAGALFAVTTRTHANSKLLMLIEPHPTRDRPLTDQASYYVGGEYGRKVLF